jgi:hypothetical protein
LALAQVHNTFATLAYAGFKPKWVETYEVQNAKEKRMKFVELCVRIKPPISLRGLAPQTLKIRIKVRNFASRELFKYDLRNIPKPEEKSDEKGDEKVSYVVLAPQVALTCSKKGVHVWEIDKALKVENRQVKWSRAKPRRLVITHDLVEFAKAVFKPVIRTFEVTLKPIFDFLRRYYYGLWRKVEYWLQGHKPIEWGFYVLEEPDPPEEKPLGYIRAYRWRA